jgi:hypothetical protein
VLIVLSPAKSLDYESPLATRKHSQPAMLDRAEELVKIMAAKSPAEIGALMGISSGLAELNFERFADWERPFTPRNARPAVLAFRGDVYLGLDAPGTFSERDYTHAQKTLRILSGLYGVLRPLDLIRPYRLEMGSRLATPEGRDLYDFWGSAITEAIDAAVEASPGSRTLVNLASNEYIKSVKPELLGAPVVSPSFLDEKDGSYTVIGFFAKRARGAMAGWAIQNRVMSAAGLRGFDRLGYRYAAERSSRLHPVFVRTEQAKQQHWRDRQV